MIGVRLEMEGILITGSRTILHNVLRCVERAGLEVADICLQPLAAGTIALNKDERNLGVALVDMGAGSTTLTVFDQGSIQFTKILPIGGDFVTKDISIGLRTTTEDAERVKVKHGHSFIDHASDEETFEVARIGSSSEQQFSQYELAHIIEPRMEEIFGLIVEELNRNGYQDLPGGFVLTGGVVAMPGVLELAREVLDQDVRISMPDYIGVREAQYTTGVGLIQFTFKNVKVQGKEVAAAISEDSSEEQQPVKKRRNQEQQRVEKDKPGVKNKMKDWFGTFFE
jgi:cell division protein FtsA